MNLLQKLYPGMKFPYNPFGYIPEPVKPGSAVYNRIFDLVVGGATKSKDWKKYLPARERQYWIPFCVSFSRLNVAEVIGNSQGIQINGSDRELGVGSGTGINGNTMEAVSEYFRKTGVRKEELVPFTAEMIAGNTGAWDKIFNLPPDNGEFRYKGGSHSWVIGRQAMIDALEFSPLQIAVPIGDTWEDDGIVKFKNASFYHAVLVYYIDSAGYYVWDTIGKEFKILAPDYPINGCKSFRDLPENWKEIMAKKFIINDGGKLGVLIIEGYAIGGGFAKDMDDLNKLKDAFDVPSDAKTITTP